MNNIKNIVSLLSMLMGSSAQAAICSLNVIGVDFGTYDVFSTTPLDSTGMIDVSCDVRTAFDITLSTGLSASYTTRQMAYGINRLNYNLYRNAAMTRILGDGTGSTVFWSANARNRSFTVYGRIPPQQNVYVGSYTDNVTVTLTF